MKRPDSKMNKYDAIIIGFGKGGKTYCRENVVA